MKFLKNRLIGEFLKNKKPYHKNFDIFEKILPQKKIIKLMRIFEIFKIFQKPTNSGYLIFQKFKN